MMRFFNRRGMSQSNLENFIYFYILKFLRTNNLGTASVIQHTYKKHNIHITEWYEISF